jgi:hypothetical protein
MLKRWGRNSVAVVRAVGQYKPTWREAVDMMRRRCVPRADVRVVALAAAHGGILARPLRAPAPFPKSRLAEMDGVAVIDGVAARHVQTGEALGTDVRRVIMDELGVALGTVVDDAADTTHVSEIACEYRAGELLAGVGQRVAPGLLSQAALLGFTELPIFAALQVGVVVVGQGPLAQAILVWLVTSLEERFPCRVVGNVVARAADVPQALAGPCQALIVASDGAPGRYAELRDLHRSPPVWYRSDFWKLNVYPCKHVGFGRIGEIPVLVLPDLLYKTALSAALLVPVVVAAFFGLDPVEEPLGGVGELPPVSGPYPYVVPLSRTGAGRAHTAIRTDCGFSGRGTVELVGLAWFEGPGAAPRLLPFGWGERGL